MKKAIIDTEKGKMTVEFYEKDAPNTVKNFTMELLSIELFQISLFKADVMRELVLVVRVIV